MKTRPYEFVNAMVSARGLALFRVLFGVLMFILVARYFAYGWIDEYFIQPEFHFKYYGFEWVRAWPAWGMYAHFAGMGVLSLFIATGFYYRFSIIAFTVLFSYFFLLDVTIYLNHYYLVCLVCFLLCFMPAHGVWSLDAARRPALRAERIPAMYLNVLRFQFAIVYFYGGIAKLNGDWLLLAQPLKIWLAGRTDLFLIGPLLAVPAAAYFFSWAGLLFDLSIPFLLWNRRTRNGAFVLLVLFHLMTRMLFPIGMFPWIMIAGATLFVSGDWLAGFRSAGALSRAWEKGNALPLKAFFAVFVFCQIVIPLRFVFYPGDVRWTEQGFRFAWRVMAMQKNGFAEFTAGGRKRDPRRHLTPFQVQQMSTQPDLILRFARFLGGKYGGPVRARVRVSLNGRPNRPLIDSRTDMNRLRDGFHAKKWISAFKESGDRVRRGSAGAERADSARPP